MSRGREYSMEEVARLYSKQGWTQSRIARKIGSCHTTVSAYLTKMGIDCTGRRKYSPEAEKLRRERRHSIRMKQKKRERIDREIAEMVRLYTVEMMSCSAIARRMGISRKTVHQRVSKRVQIRKPAPRPEPKPEPVRFRRQEPTELVEHLIRLALRKGRAA